MDVSTLSKGECIRRHSLFLAAQRYNATLVNLDVGRRIASVLGKRTFFRQHFCHIEYR